MTLEGSAVPPRRRSSEETVDRIAVRRAISELVRSIGTLQADAALLRTLANTSHCPEDLFARTVSVGQSISAARAQLDEIVATLPPRQRRHGRIEDLERALVALSNSLPRPN